MFTTPARLREGRSAQIQRQTAAQLSSIRAFASKNRRNPQKSSDLIPCLTVEGGANPWFQIDDRSLIGVAHPTFTRECRSFHGHY